MARIKRDPKTVALAQEIAKQFDPQSAEDADEALKELFGPIFESLLQGEMSHHLGYENNNKEKNKRRIVEMDMVKKLFILQREISR